MIASPDSEITAKQRQLSKQIERLNKSFKGSRVAHFYGDGTKVPGYYRWPDGSLRKTPPKK